ncbi:MAG: hypothetical protein QM820_36255 [Minicystis sp.]
MDWFPIATLLAVTALPVAFAVAGEIKQRRFRARWREEAARLGLESEGSIPFLRISGTMNGVQIDLVQSATYPPKQAAVYSYTARAGVPARVEDERAILSSYRTEPRRAEDPLARDVFTDLTPVDGWFELRGQGMLDPDDIEPLLRRLVRTAKAEALAQAEREDEEERKQADRR